MAIPFQNDLDVIFADDPFSTEVTFTHSGSSVSVKGFFDNPIVQKGNFGLTDVHDGQPRFFCRTAKVPNIAKGDTITVGENTYTVQEFDKDGQGMIEIVLSGSGNVDVPFTDDLDTLFADTSFGVTATYTHSGVSSEVKIYFDNPTIEVGALGYAAIHEVQPKVTCRSADVPSLTSGDTFVIGGNEYIVEEHINNGHGVVQIRLSGDAGVSNDQRGTVSDTISSMFNVNEFATAATLTRTGGAAITVNGIFDNETVKQGQIGSVSIIQEQPRFVCETQQNLVSGDFIVLEDGGHITLQRFTGNLMTDDTERYNVIGATLAVNSVNYIIRELISDGVGISVFHLEKQ